MTEDQWFNERHHAQRMATALDDISWVKRTKAGRRKVRLFACGCCRLIWPLLRDPRLREAVDLGERFAEGNAVKADLERTYDVIRGLSAGSVDFNPKVPSEKYRVAAAMAIATILPRTTIVAYAVTAYPFSIAAAGVGLKKGESILCDLMRDVFGNPFQPLQARKFPQHVLGLARSCYAAFPEVGEDYLILADAMEDIGELTAAAHCREKVHVKGCHVLDGILGKS